MDLLDSIFGIATSYKSNVDNAKDSYGVFPSKKKTKQNRGSNSSFASI